MRNNDLYKKRGRRSGNQSRKQDIRSEGGNTENEADRVLAAFEDALARGGDPDLLLKEFVERYPTHRTDLAHAASEFSARTLAEARSGEEIPDSLIDKVVMEIPIPSGAIHEQARRSGIAFPERLAALLRVSPVFLERLQRYEIDPGTIPGLFAARMAEILKIPVPVCVSMFRNEQRFKMIVYEVKKKVSFAQALRESCSPEDIEHWFGESS